MSCAVKAEDLSLSFDGKQVLDHVTFEVQPGEIFGLLGPSGAGKTTLIRILTGQLGQDGGYATLLGKDTREMNREHGQIGLMMDDFGWYERLSAADNLAFYADIYRVPRSGIGEILRSVGLYESRKTTVSKLSKGMRNRLSLARALMNQGKVLFLDEPTAGLDPVTTREIHAVLARQRENGTTIFLTTHNMFEAESLCGRVALLNGGRIVECGKPEEICRKYNHLNQLRVTLQGGETVFLENSGAAVPRLRRYLEQGAVEAIHSTEPTLEAVFLELTGRGLE